MLKSCISRFVKWADEFGVETWRGPSFWVIWKVLLGLPAFLFSRPLSFVLERSHLMLRLGLMLIVVGFHFDLLVS